MLGRRVLRARTPAGIAQEVYALLAVYQIIRIAIADATGSAPGTDPDRASFTIALETARDQVIQAANVIAGTVIDLVGTIGRRVLDNLMPDRRLRLSPRAVKRPLSRYAYKSLGPAVQGKEAAGRCGGRNPHHQAWHAVWFRPGAGWSWRERLRRACPV